MTQQEYRDFLHSIHAIDRTVVEVAYMSALEEEERRECLSLLLHRAEEIREPADKVKALWAETAEKMEEKKRESTFVPFVPFVPPDESKKPSFPVEHLPDGIREYEKAGNFSAFSPLIYSYVFFGRSERFYMVSEGGI